MTEIKKGENQDQKKTTELQGLVMPIRNCEELKAILKVRISAKIKDESLVKELENALADIVDYGAGGTNKHLSG